MGDKAALLREQIRELTAQYFCEAFPQKDFIPGVSPVPVSGKVIDSDDISSGASWPDLSASVRLRW
jgi:CDP-6-deoxy-D-xylo-4-hexulose-3-dehydrase